jgi:hypothetical protein
MSGDDTKYYNLKGERENGKVFRRCPSMEDNEKQEYAARFSKFKFIFESDIPR